MTDPDVMFFVTKIREAATAREIADLLLRVPDAIVLSHGVQLGAESEKMRFGAGAMFLIHRAAGLSAVRDAHGLMPERIAGEIEAWRETFSRFAAGQRRSATPGGVMPDGGSDGAPTPQSP